MKNLGEEAALEEEGFVQEEIHEAKLRMASIYAEGGRYERAVELLRDVLAETRDWRVLKVTSSWAQEAARRASLVRAGLARSCGHEALAQVLRRSGFEVSEEEVGQLLGSAASLSMDDLRVAAERKGLRMEGVRLSADQSGAIPSPAISLLRPGHFVVVTGVEGDEVLVVDPERSGGILRFDRSTFEKWWTGELLAGSDRIPRELLSARLEERELAELRGGHDELTDPPATGGGGRCDNPNAEFDRFDQALGHCSQGMPGIAVNTKNLNLVIEEMDLSYSGLGPSVDVVRYHNGNATANRGLGFGWSMKYQTYLRKELTGNVVVQRGSGAQQRFVSLGGGNFAAPKGIHDRLTQNPDGTYALWVKGERLTQEFDASGKLLAVRDGRGHALTLQNVANIPTVFGYYPSNLAASSDGYVYAVWGNENKVRKYDNNGNLVLQWGATGSGDGQFDKPMAVVVDLQGYVYVLDANNHRIQKFDSSGNFVTKWGSYGTGDDKFIFGATSPVYGVAADNQGYIYVTDPGNMRVKKFTSNGEAVLIDPPWTLRGGRGIAVSSNGYVYVSFMMQVDTMWHGVAKYTSNGTFAGQWYSAGPGSGPGQFNEPFQVAVDSTGYVYVVDYRNHRIQRFDANGGFNTQWGGQGQGDGEFHYPTSVTVDSGGYVYGGDSRIQKFRRDMPVGTRVNSVTDAVGRLTSFGYNGANQLTSITGPMGGLTFGYDSYGNLQSSTNLAGASTTYTYDPANHYIQSITTPKGATEIDYCWDRNVGYHLSSIRDAAGHVRKYGYDGATDQQPCCRLGDSTCNFNYAKTFVKDALGHTTWYQSNTDGFTTIVTDPLNHTTTYGYDSAGNRNSITNADTKTLSLTYDDHGNIWTITEPAPLNHTTTFAYDARDNLTDVWDALNRNYHLTYFPNDNLETIRDPLLRVTSFTYDALGQIETMTNARGKVFSFGHDADGNLTDVNGPLSW
ncbi:MAG: cysteine peptidase family C39 domain-containing protein, partial [Acidobacteriota bacterium]